MIIESLIGTLPRVSWYYILLNIDHYYIFKFLNQTLLSHEPSSIETWDGQSQCSWNWIKV